MRTEIIFKSNCPFFIISITYSPIIYYLYVCITDDKEAKERRNKGKKYDIINVDNNSALNN